MTIKSDLLAALTPVLANTYAVTLPNNPTWPALLFEVETEKETGWIPDGVYKRHSVTVTIFSTSLSQVASLRDQVATAMGPLSDHNGPEDEGDATYEGDAAAYAYFLNFHVRSKELI